MTAIAAAAIGTNHNALVDHDGTLWVCGANDAHQLGIPDAAGHPTHTVGHHIAVPDLPPMTAVACGTAFTLALDTEQRVWAAGTNTAGQFGAGIDTLGRFTRLHIGDIDQIAAGGHLAALLDLDAEVWAAGDLGTTRHNRFTTLDGLSAITIACGTRHVAALDLDGQLWTSHQHRIPVAASGVLAAHNAVTAIAGTSGVHRQQHGSAPEQIYGAPTNIADVAISETGGFAITDNGGLWGWGSNHFGTLGDPRIGPSTIDAIPLAFPTVARSVVTNGLGVLVVDTAGDVWAAGRALGVGTGNQRSWARLRIGAPYAELAGQLRGDTPTGAGSGSDSLDIDDAYHQAITFG